MVTTINMNYFTFIFFAVVFGACSQQHDVNITDIPFFGGIHAEPNLQLSSTGRIHLSYLEHVDDTTYNLMFTTLNEGQWREPKLIAYGNDWFVNWADFPSLTTYPDTDEAMVAHWLAMRAEGTYDYDVNLSQSMDGGKTWTEPFIPHRDGIAAEHGFVSIIPLREDLMMATWLDGRNTKMAMDPKADNHGHGGGAMTLRTASFDRKGQLYDEAELDSRVCDCCQTSAALTRSGPIVAYRDRSEREVRDISVVRRIDGIWTEPQRVFPDNWKILGCPVNGPVITARKDLVAIGWFTIRDSIPEVKVAFSPDDGGSFEEPFKVDNGHPLGRIGLEFISDQKVFVSWVENAGNYALIKGQILTPEGKLGESIEIARTSASRRSGFPQICGYGNDLIVAWTAVDETTAIKTALITIPSE